MSESEVNDQEIEQTMPSEEEALNPPDYAELPVGDEEFVSDDEAADSETIDNEEWEAEPPNLDGIDREFED